MTDIVSQFFSENFYSGFRITQIGFDRNCEIFLPFFNFLKNITFWCQSTQENVYGTNKQCCSH